MQNIDDISSLKIFKDNYSPYVYNRIFSNYKSAIDYVKENTNQANKWYVLLYDDNNLSRTVLFGESSLFRTVCMHKK